jgi:hypothetical protein
MRLHLTQTIAAGAYFSCHLTPAFMVSKCCRVTVAALSLDCLIVKGLNLCIGCLDDSASIEHILRSLSIAGASTWYTTAGLSLTGVRELSTLCTSPKLIH